MKNDSLNVSDIRKTYVKAVEDKQKTEAMLKKLDKQDSLSPILLAYKGAFEGLMAKHAWNPYKKLKYLNISQKTLEKAIKQDAQNIEVRFLRFSIQHYLPPFLNQSNELDIDRQTIIKHLNSPTNQQLGTDVIQGIIRFLIESKRCTDAELTELKTHQTD